MASQNWNQPHAIRIAQFLFGLLIVVGINGLTKVAGEENPTEFPAVERLPSVASLPDPFLKPDGTRVGTRSEWESQRTYLKRVLAYYMYGHMPPAPEQVGIEQTLTRAAFDGDAIEEHYTLTFTRNDRQAKLRIALFRPKERQRYPTIIKNCRVLFDPEDVGEPAKNRTTAERDLKAAREAVKRGYLICKFRREDIAADRPNNRNSGIFPLYPEYDWGTIAAWAWTYQPLINELDELGYADANRIVATGHSRGGQTTIAAGIFDERIDVVVPCTGGYGSCGTLRIRDPQGVRGTLDYIAHLERNVPHWFCDRYLEFTGQQNKLPFDAHTLVALIAPRPLLNTNATEDEYNNTLSIEAGLRAGRLVYQWMDASEHCRLHWRPGKHGQLEADWRALLDFADEQFFDRPGTSSFNAWVYPGLELGLPWDVPQNGD